MPSQKVHIDSKKGWCVCIHVSQGHIHGRACTILTCNDSLEALDELGSCSRDVLLAIRPIQIAAKLVQLLNKEWRQRQGGLQECEQCWEHLGLQAIW